MTIRWCAFIVLMCGAGAWAQESDVSLAELELSLRERLVQSPDDASSWRLLGKLALDRQDPTAALDAFRQAIRCDPYNIAAYFGLGEAAKALEQYGDAELAYQHVLELAPDSEYAIEALEALQALPSKDAVTAANYEIRTFDGSNLLPLITDPIDEPTPAWNDRVEVHFDLGSQWNSNVGLAPSSRELYADGQASAQALASLTVKWYVYDSEQFRIGPMFDSDFTFNEGSFQRYDLQSYRPGVTASGRINVGSRQLRPRVTYLFTHDEFDGNSFGNKHSLSSSLGIVWNPQRITTPYWSIDNNHIYRDGTNPDITSQDGWANTVGVLHDFIFRDSRFRNFRIGADYQNANTVGSTYRYQAASIYTQSVFIVQPKLHLTMNASWATRDYPDFTGTPSRNTHIWRTGGELRRYFDHGLSVALVTQYTSFQSENEQFSTDRFLAGGMFSWDY